MSTMTTSECNACGKSEPYDGDWRPLPVGWFELIFQESEDQGCTWAEFCCLECARRWFEKKRFHDVLASGGKKTTPEGIDITPPKPISDEQIAAAFDWFRARDGVTSGADLKEMTLDSAGLDLESFNAACEWIMGGRDLTKEEFGPLIEMFGVGFLIARQVERMNV